MTSNSSDIYLWRQTNFGNIRQALFTALQSISFTPSFPLNKCHALNLEMLVISASQASHNVIHWMTANYIRLLKFEYDTRGLS